MSPVGYFEPGTLAIAKRDSHNAKIGKCATTYAAQASCPTDCVFFDGGGCYAETGWVGKTVTAPLNEAATSVGIPTPRAVAQAEAGAIDRLSLRDGRPLRLHTVGDCATDEAARIVAAAAEDYMVNGGGPVWTYTHAWRTVDRASWGLVSVLASCETAADVKLAHERGYATSIVVEEFVDDRRYSKRNVNVLPCPAQTRDRDCASCGLCFNDRRLREERLTIGFEVHGIPVTIKRAKLALRDPDDPDRRLDLETQLRRLLETRPLIGPHEAARIVGMDSAYVATMLNHIRDGAPHPAQLRAQRRATRKRRLRAQQGQAAEPCGRFELGPVQTERGPRRCACGWLLTQHTAEARNEWKETRRTEKRLYSRDYKRERRHHAA